MIHCVMLSLSKHDKGTVAAFVALRQAQGDTLCAQGDALRAHDDTAELPALNNHAA